MASSVTTSIMPSQFQHRRNSELFSFRKCCNQVVFSHQNSRNNAFLVIEESLSMRSLFGNPGRICIKNVHKRISAVGSGLETSFSDSKESLIAIKDAEIVVESQDENKIQLRVDLPGKETEKVFNKVLMSLARTAPPIPGFRREKGGRTTKVPKSFLLQVLGEERVTKFVIQEIVSSTLADYAKKETVKVKENKANTLQSAEELKKSFSPGNAFGFTAVLELETPETETETEPDAGAEAEAETEMESEAESSSSSD